MQSTSKGKGCFPVTLASVNFVPNDSIMDMKELGIISVVMDHDCFLRDPIHDNLVFFFFNLMLPFFDLIESLRALLEIFYLQFKLNGRYLFSFLKSWVT